LQKSYLKVLEGKARFGGRSSFRTWFFGVIRRTAYEHGRQRKVRWAPLSGREPSPHRSADDRIEDLERATVLSDALARISARQREVLHLVFYEGMTIEQAASVVGVSVGTARRHYERGKARLSAELAKSHWEVP
jgi:RNA polymerase sigma-70 factor (ECF subfamily)